MSTLWLPVPGFEGMYDVSDDGRVRSWRGPHMRGENRLRVPFELVPGVSRHGYQKVCLYRGDGSTMRTSVHIVVALAFLGPRPEGMETRHLDGDNQNNVPSNLAYGTHSDNSYDMVRHGRHRNASKTHCPQGHPYDEANTKQNARTGWRSCRECCREHDRRQRLRLKAQVA